MGCTQLDCEKIQSSIVVLSISVNPKLWSNIILVLRRAIEIVESDVKSQAVLKSLPACKLLFSTLPPKKVIGCGAVLSCFIKCFPDPD